MSSHNHRNDNSSKRSSSRSSNSKVNDVNHDSNVDGDGPGNSYAGIDTDGVWSDFWRRTLPLILDNNIHVDGVESGSSGYGLCGHQIDPTAHHRGTVILKDDNYSNSSPETSYSSDDISDACLGSVSHSPQERRMSYRYTDPRQPLLYSPEHTCFSTSTDLSRLVLHFCLQATKAEGECHHHLTHARRSEEADDSFSWRENRDVNNSSVASRACHTNIRTCLEGPRQESKHQIDFFTSRGRPNLSSELERQRNGSLLSRQTRTCQTGEDRLEDVDELLKLTAVAAVSDQASGYNNTSTMIPVYFSESISLGPVPNYEEHCVTTCVNYSDMKRYNETVDFHMNLNPVKFASSVFCFHDNSRKRFKTYVEFVPRVKPRRFADSMVIRPKTSQTAYVSVLNYHIDECRRWFKSTLELRAKMYTTTKIQPVGLSNKQQLNNNETDVVDRHTDESKEVELNTQPLVKSQISHDVTGPSYHLSGYSTECFPPETDKHSGVKLLNGYLGSSGEDSHTSSEEDDTYV